MLTETQFKNLMIDVVDTNFPDAADAFAEQIDTAATDFYAGNTARHLSTPNDSTKADFEFNAGEIAGALPVVISSLTMIKLAAEAYIAICKAFSNANTSKPDSVGSVPGSVDVKLPKVESEVLQSDLSKRLQAYLPAANAANVASEIVAHLRA